MLTLSFCQLSHISALVWLAMFLDNHELSDHSNLVYILSVYPVRELSGHSTTKEDDRSLITFLNCTQSLFPDPQPEDCFFSWAFNSVLSSGLKPNQDETQPLLGIFILIEWDLFLLIEVYNSFEGFFAENNCILR